jgi:hypothetical protein
LLNKTYFWNPYALWQTERIENANGVMRPYIISQLKKHKALSIEYSEIFRNSQDPLMTCPENVLMDLPR